MNVRCWYLATLVLALLLVLEVVLVVVLVTASTPIQVECRVKCWYSKNQGLLTQYQQQYILYTAGAGNPEQTRCKVI